VEIILEPDTQDPWTGTQIGQALVAAAQRLQAHGFRPDFIAPSTTSLANAITRFDEMIRVPGVLSYLTELAYHRYAGVSDANLRAVADRAVQYGLKTAMLEHIGSGYEDLHKDLTLGRVSAWQQFILAYPTSDNNAQYYVIDSGKPNTLRVTLGKQSKFLQQYFRYIRPGAMRIEASSIDAALAPVAFVYPNGTCVVVVKVNQRKAFTIGGLPEGTYGITYTTASQFAAAAPDVVLDTGQTLSTRIPEPGVLTVYAK
jgi:hypothetical protein